VNKAAKPYGTCILEHPYLSNLDANVLSVEGRDVMISPTIFFAESGGQESDSGTINHIEVSQAIVDGDRIIYRLAADPDFAVAIGSMCRSTGPGATR
jgi:Ser-tRNA(Ala) deacylase AlaX